MRRSFKCSSFESPNMRVFLQDVYFPSFVIHFLFNQCLNIFWVAACNTWKTGWTAYFQSATLSRPTPIFSNCWSSGESRGGFGGSRSPFLLNLLKLHLVFSVQGIIRPIYCMAGCLFYIGFPV